MGATSKVDRFDGLAEVAYCYRRQRRIWHYYELADHDGARMLVRRSRTRYAFAVVWVTGLGIGPAQASFHGTRQLADARRVDIAARYGVEARVLEIQSEGVTDAE